MAQMVLALIWIAGIVVILVSGGDHLYAATGAIWVGRYIWAWWMYHTWRHRPVHVVEIITLIGEICFAAAYWTWVALTGI
jgi:hypothetical protein